MNREHQWMNRPDRNCPSRLICCSLRDVLPYTCVAPLEWNTHSRVPAPDDMCTKLYISQTESLPKTNWTSIYRQQCGTRSACTSQHLRPGRFSTRHPWPGRFNVLLPGPCSKKVLLGNISSPLFVSQSKSGSISLSITVGPVVDKQSDNTLLSVSMHALRITPTAF